MKKLLYLCAFILFTACGSDDPVAVDPIVETTNGITTLDATGTVSEQTAVEAKKIIYGKWNFSNTSRGVANTCTFSYLEFNDEDYIMGFVVDGNSQTIYGSYVLNEDSGTVSSVDLNFYAGTSNLTIATLTDVVVTETNDNFSAVFNVEWSIPENAGFDSCNNLAGEYTAAKEEPMDESTTADADSNHVKLIKTWSLVSVFEEGEDRTDEWYNDPCIIEYDDDTEEQIENCTPATSMTLTFSTYGSYTFVWTGSSNGTKVETEPWSWNDTNQTGFNIGNENQLVRIVSLTDTEAVFSSEGTEITFSAN